MPQSAPAIRIRSFLAMAPYLARHGISVIEFCARLGISPNVFRNADGWLPRALCFHMANEVAAQTGDPFAGAHVGQSAELHEIGEWGQSALAARTVGEACMLAASNGAMVQRGSDIRFLTEGGAARIVFRFTNRYDFDPRQFIFGSLAVLRKVPLLAGEPSAIKVRLTADKMRGTDALEECLGSNIEMGCEYDTIEIDRDLLNIPLNIQKNRPSKMKEALSSAEVAAKLLGERLSDAHELKLEAVARSVGLSPRTLQRRLKFCGVEFEELLDETRRSEAIRLLGEGTTSMTDIAFRVGYSDSAHFSRAFKRWTGVAPSRFEADRSWQQ